MALVCITKRLRDCKLWSGSNTLKYEFDHFGLTVASVDEAIAAKKRCDDLTSDEMEYLGALEEIRAQHRSAWNE